MKWDVKHDKAKGIIVAALDEAQMWFTDKEKIAGLTEEEVGEVNKELTMMLDSIRKRYKLDVRLKNNAPEAVEPQAEIEKEEVEDRPQEEEKPKRRRRTISGTETEKKPRTRKKKGDAARGITA